MNTRKNLMNTPSYLMQQQRQREPFVRQKMQQQMEQSQQLSPQQVQAINLANRNAIIGSAIRRQQQIFQTTFNPTAGVVIDVSPRMAGLLLGFFVDISVDVDCGTNNYLRTQWGPANFLQQVRYDDLSNNTRIQTTGWHLNAVNTAKVKYPFLAVSDLNAYPVGYGNVLTANIAVAPATLTTAGATCKMTFWVPLAYSEMDLRGSEWINVVNATANLQLTMATTAQAFVAETADPTGAVYQADATGATGIINSYTVTVHQVYYDQLPIDPRTRNPALPVLDLSTMYQLWNTTLSGVVTGQDFNIPYANFRSYLSTVVIYDNQVTGDYPAAASDLNYWELQTANFTNIFKYPGWFPGVYERLNFGTDTPLGSYYFSTRERPINTVQFGNMQLIMNPTGTVQAGANVRVGWEFFAVTNTLVGAASLAGAGN